MKVNEIVLKILHSSSTQEKQSERQFNKLYIDNGESDTKLMILQKELNIPKSIRNSKLPNSRKAINKY